jgi:single-stranded-DNA-specific exonuclease
MQVTLRELGTTLYRDMSRLAPFGKGNPKPVFRVARVHIGDIRQFGKEKNHFECSLSCKETGARARAYDFFRTADSFSQVPAADTEVSVYASLERDTFRGGFALRLIDISGD